MTFTIQNESGDQITLSLDLSQASLEQLGVPTLAAQQKAKKEAEEVNWKREEKLAKHRAVTLYVEGAEPQHLDQEGAGVFVKMSKEFVADFFSGGRTSNYALHQLVCAVAGALNRLDIPGIPQFLRDHPNTDSVGGKV